MTEQTKTPNVLIVDDDVDTGIFVSTLFESNGYQPVVTRDGGSGLAKAREVNPDLIVLDLMMPGDGGVEMYRALKSDPALVKTPVIMLSSVARKTFSHYLKVLNVRNDDMPPGLDTYIEKPPDARELMELANRLIGQIKAM